MKIKNFRKIILSIAFIFIMSITYAQMMGPEDPGTGPEAGDPPVGGGAPVGGGIIILLTFGVAYGGKKVFDLIKGAGENSDFGTK